jgi:pimeloyl-ACP methyl ester carboxylesterase
MDMRKLLLFGFFAVVLLGAGAFLGRLSVRPHPEDQRPGKFPEQVVYVRSADDVVSAGVMFTPPKEASKPLAIIWVHGWGVNFYLPSYVGIGRALADRGFTTISVDTRMHDLGSIEKYTFFDKRVRGGGYWGVTSEDARDIAAWVSFAEQLVSNRVILVGHSAGWASVGRYQADSTDKRVAGLVFASGGVGGAVLPDDSAEHRSLVEQARKLVADGAGDDLLRLPSRSYASYISAATYLDIENTRREYGDFFGTTTSNAPVSRVKVPILAFFGTKGDVGGEKELDLLSSSVRRLNGGARTITATMIANGDHEYVGQEAQVASKISEWVETTLLRR